MGMHAVLRREAAFLDLRRKHPASSTHLRHQHPAAEHPQAPPGAAASHWRRGRQRRRRWRHCQLRCPRCQQEQRAWVHHQQQQRRPGARQQASEPQRRHWAQQARTAWEPQPRRWVQQQQQRERLAWQPQSSLQAQPALPRRALQPPQAWLPAQPAWVPLPPPRARQGWGQRRWQQAGCPAGWASATPQQRAVPRRRVQPSRLPCCRLQQPGWRPALVVPLQPARSALLAWLRAWLRREPPTTCKSQASAENQRKTGAARDQHQQVLPGRHPRGAGGGGAAAAPSPRLVARPCPITELAYRTLPTS